MHLFFTDMKMNLPRQQMLENKSFSLFLLLQLLPVVVVLSLCGPAFGPSVLQQWLVLFVQGWLGG